MVSRRLGKDIKGANRQGILTFHRAHCVPDNPPHPRVHPHLPPCKAEAHSGALARPALLYSYTQEAQLALKGPYHSSSELVSLSYGWFIRSLPYPRHCAKHLSKLSTVCIQSLSSRYYHLILTDGEIWIRKLSNLPPIKQHSALNHYPDCFPGSSNPLQFTSPLIHHPRMLSSRSCFIISKEIGIFLNGC